MLLKTKNIAARRRMNRAAQRDLDTKLEALVDPTYLDRATNYVAPRKPQSLVEAVDNLQAAGHHFVKTVSNELATITKKVRH